MVEIIEHSKKFRCKRPLCYFETDDLERLRNHQRDHRNYDKNLNGD